jgi:DNA-binding CsgD family transcriptional regulator
LLDGSHRRRQADLLLVEALGLAGRVDEALAAGDDSLDRLAAGPGGPVTSAELHVAMAAAAIAASRWSIAAGHLDRARSLLTNRSLLTDQSLLTDRPRLTDATDASVGRAKVAVMDAEVALARDDHDLARQRAEEALAAAPATAASRSSEVDGTVTGRGDGAEVRCQALEIVGRIERARDLGRAREAFALALDTAERARLPLWRLRALHELGTVDLFDHGGCEHLLAARARAGELGALSTVAVLDLQLAAVCHCRFELDRAAAHARDALVATEQLGLEQAQVKALYFLAENHALRGDRDEMERALARLASGRAAAIDPALEGFAWAGARGMAALLGGDRAGAFEAFERGIERLRPLPHAEPANFRGVWPLLLAARGDRRASVALDEARRAGVTVTRANRGLLGYAEAILLGRSGAAVKASTRATAADADLAFSPIWSDLARLLAAGPARADGWGRPDEWLVVAEAAFSAQGLAGRAEECREARHEPTAALRRRFGITSRECDVLVLLAAGLANKEIATRLRRSPRTVEKHVENLLRKTGSRSRTELATRTAAARDGVVPRPGIVAAPLPTT